jgi:hypothetical protein
MNVSATSLLTTAIAVTLPLLLPAHPARADCAADISAVAARLPGIENDRTKELVAFDLKRARQELAEGDEDECQEAMDHAHSLLDATKP